MPKEMTHWIVAGMAAKTLAPGLIRDSILAYPALFDIGAVVCDSPFYAYPYRYREIVLAVAARLHDNGTADAESIGESLERVYGMGIKGKPEGRPPQSSLPGNGPAGGLVSFISGVVTHLVADTVFHPLVNYFCGRYDASNKHRRRRSQIRHRFFESCLDLFFKQYAGISPANAGYLARTLRAAQPDLAAVDPMVRDLYGARDIPTLVPLLRRHALWQGLFFRPFYRDILAILAAAGGGDAARLLAATFYPSIDPAKMALFQEDITYRLPGGEVRTDSVTGLLKRTVTESCTLLDAFRTALDQGRAGSFLGSLPRLSLETGNGLQNIGDAAFADLGLPMVRLITAPPGRLPPLAGR